MKKWYNSVKGLIRIEPNWNVNAIAMKEPVFALLIRIEPNWNVNTSRDTSFLFSCPLE